MAGTMADEQDEDELFDRLARSLRAVRQDADLVRTSGAEAVSTGLARAEAELRTLAGRVEALHQRVAQQHAVIVRLEAAAATREADLQALRQTVEALSHRVLDPPQLPSVSSVRKPPPRVAIRIGIVFVILVLVLAGGAAAWVASGREPSLGALAHRVLVRLSELSGIDLAGSEEQARSVPTAEHMPPAPDPALRSSAPAAAAAAPVTAAPPPAAVADRVEAPSAAPAPPAVPPPAAASLPPAREPAAIPAPQTAAGAVQQPAKADMAASQPAAAAAPPVVQSEPPAPVAAAFAQSPRPSQSTHQLVLRANANTWVRVRQKDGRVLLSRTMKPGEMWPVPAEQDLTLDAGNVEGLDLDVDGVPTRLTGAAGGVVHNVPLDAALLRSGAAGRAAH
jgi:uncharacterized coiled-coil protein SlyX